MNPEFIDNMSWEMAEVYGAITDQIMVNLAKYFPYYHAGDRLPKSAFTYQATMLAHMGQVNRETMAIIRNGLADADDALKMCLEQAIMDSVQKAEKPLLQAVKKGIFAPPQVPVVSPNQMQAFTTYYKQAASKLNLVNTVMLESTQGAYKQTVNDIVWRIQQTQTALDIGAGETITGVSSWNEAVRHSINRMKERGITGFVDHGGHQWSAEAYTAMDIRTTMMNTGRAAIWETNSNFGNDLYLVSYHNGARPGCYDWQNKVISSTNTARETVDLDGNAVQVYAQSSTTYGQPAGLFGINCKHYPTPFVPGISTIRGQVQSPEENARSYAESQEQRRLERKLREQKRDVLMAKAQGASPEEIKALENRAKATSADINDFCANTGRARHRDREAVYTKREFPDKSTYKVADFEQWQKNAVQAYYDFGGAQYKYSKQVRANAGMMIPNIPLKPKPPVVPPASAPNPQPVQQPTPQATQQPATTLVQSTGGHSKLTKEVLPNNSPNIKQVPVRKYTVQPTDEQIIAAVGGADKTSGSCASVSLAYAGNKAGYDVRDFRGGASMDWFSTKTNTQMIVELPGVKGWVIDSAKEIETANELLAKMQPGHEYWLGVGRHASIVRKSATGYEYLELQSATNNGWHTLNDFELKYRFGCSADRGFDLPARMMDIEKLGKDPDFPEILRYINTAVDKQKKGVGGGIK